MEARKIIAFGGNSYVVSLPKSWVVARGLKKGNLVSVHEQGNDLVFSVHNAPRFREQKTLTIITDNKSLDMIQSEIVAGYLDNTDTLEILGKEIKNASQIKEMIRNLSGLEIMMQTSTRITAKDLLNSDDISVKTIIRRMDVIARAMIDDAMDCIGGASRSEEINSRDADINRLHFLAFRVLKYRLKNRSSKGDDAWELFLEREMVSKIENVADYQKRIARYITLLPLVRQKKKELQKIHGSIRTAYLDAMKAYYHTDKKLAFEVEVGNRRRIIMCNDFFKDTGNYFTANTKNDIQNSFAQLARIVENLKAMSSSVKYIARLVIEMEK